MVEVKRPQEWEMYNGGGIRHSVYLKADADAYIAALERRARVATEALRYEFWSRHPVYAEDMLVELALKHAEQKIDAEKGEQSDG